MSPAGIVTLIHGGTTGEGPRHETTWHKTVPHAAYTVTVERVIGYTAHAHDSEFALSPPPSHRRIACPAAGPSAADQYEQVRRIADIDTSLALPGYTATVGGATVTGHTLAQFQAEKTPTDPATAHAGPADVNAVARSVFASAPGGVLAGGPHRYARPHEIPPTSRGRPRCDMRCGRRLLHLGADPGGFGSVRVAGRRDDSAALR